MVFISNKARLYWKICMSAFPVWWSILLVTFLLILLTWHLRLEIRSVGCSKIFIITWLWLCHYLLQLILIKLAIKLILKKDLKKSFGGFFGLASGQGLEKTIFKVSDVWLSQRELSLGRWVSDETGLGGSSDNLLVFHFYTFKPRLFEIFGWACITFLKKCNILENKGKQLSWKAVCLIQWNSCSRKHYWCFLFEIALQTYSTSVRKKGGGL